MREVPLCVILCTAVSRVSDVDDVSLGVSERGCCSVVSTRANSPDKKKRPISARPSGGARQWLPVFQGQVKVRLGCTRGHGEGRANLGWIRTQVAVENKFLWGTMIGRIE